ncbi:MAG: hypothetical protein O8C59_01840 [Candidatus Methanoperedens sp.]|nr:hypothetical protein [Candidatus Methanoperedens sp.]
MRLQVGVSAAKGCLEGAPAVLAEQVRLKTDDIILNSCQSSIKTKHISVALTSWHLTGKWMEGRFLIQKKTARLWRAGDELLCPEVAILNL